MTKEITVKRIFKARDCLLTRADIFGRGYYASMLSRLDKLFWKTSKAFSLVELLVTMSIIAILAGIASAVYNNIVNNASKLATNADQQTLYNCIMSSTLSGQDIQQIVSQGYSPEVEAIALTYYLNHGSNSVERMEKGTMGAFLPSNEIIIPAPGTYTGNRIGITMRGTPIITTSGPGFITVPTASAMGQAFVNQYEPLILQASN